MGRKAWGGDWVELSAVQGKSSVVSAEAKILSNFSTGHTPRLLKFCWHMSEEAHLQQGDLHRV